MTTLGYLAAQTWRIWLAPLVVVLGYHHPLEIVKRYGTLDLISGGRVVLGVGVGGTEGEFALLGASFWHRGKRADESIAAIRASLGVAMPAYEGTYYSFSGMVVDPTLRAGTPLWVAAAAARRYAGRCGPGAAGRRRDCSRRMPGRCSPSSIPARSGTWNSRWCSCRVPSR